jgi:hypothetical protein
MLIVHIFAAKLGICGEDGEADPPDSGIDQGFGFVPSGETLSAGVIQVDGHLAIADGLHQFKEVRITAYIAISFDNDSIRARMEGLLGHLEDHLIQGFETGFNLQHLPGAIVASLLMGFTSPAARGLYPLHALEVTEAAEVPAIQAGPAADIHNYFHGFE